MFKNVDFVVRPPAGSPAANSSFKPSEISDTIDFSRGLPGSFYNFFFQSVENFLSSGTKYDFWLYYSNSTISDWLTWTGKKSFLNFFFFRYLSCSMCQSLVWQTEAFFRAIPGSGSPQKGFQQSTVVHLSPRPQSVALQLPSWHPLFANMMPNGVSKWIQVDSALAPWIDVYKYAH